MAISLTRGKSSKNGTKTYKIDVICDDPVTQLMSVRNDVLELLQGIDGPIKAITSLIVSIKTEGPPGVDKPIFSSTEFQSRTFAVLAGYDVDRILSYAEDKIIKAASFYKQSKSKCLIYGIVSHTLKVRRYDPKTGTGQFTDLVCVHGASRDFFSSRPIPTLCYDIECLGKPVSAGCVRHPQRGSKCSNHYKSITTDVSDSVSNRSL